MKPGLKIDKEVEEIILPNDKVYYIATVPVLAEVSAQINGT